MTQAVRIVIIEDEAGHYSNHQDVIRDSQNQFHLIGKAICAKLHTSASQRLLHSLHNLSIFMYAKCKASEV